MNYMSIVYVVSEFVNDFLQEVFNKFVSPDDVVTFSESDLVSKCHIYNPMFDYVPPELITFYITNTYVHKFLTIRGWAGITSLCGN